MKFADLFGKATSRRIKYSEYDVAQAEGGKYYIMPTKAVVPSVYPELSLSISTEFGAFSLLKG